MTTTIEKLRKSRWLFIAYYFMKDGTIFTQKMWNYLCEEELEELNRLEESSEGNDDYVVRLINQTRNRYHYAAIKVLVHSTVFDKWYCTKDSFNKLKSYYIYEMTGKEETLLALTAEPAKRRGLK